MDTGQPTSLPPQGVEQPTVSAIIPAYNATGTIERALQSVYAQDYPSLIEVIVVDDGSTDETAALVARQFPRATLVRQENGGNAAARNRGAQEAHGDYLAFLDADDEWLPDHLSALLAASAGAARADLLMCQEAYAQADGTLQRPRVQDGLHALDFHYWLVHERLTLGFSYCCSGWLLRREAFADVGSFDASLRQCVDVEFLLRFTCLGHTVAGVTHPGYKRYVQRESVSMGRVPSVRGPLSYCQIVRAYAPDPSRPSGRMLSPLEYEGILKRALALAAQALIASGRAPEARERFQEARRLRGGSVQVRLGIALGAVAPHTLSWLYRQVWLRLRRLETAIRLARGYVRVRATPDAQ